MIILDGGLGHQLRAVGAPFRQPEWSALALMEAPQFVREVHDQFIAAGADVITTNSYAVVPFHIGEDRFEAQAGELLALAAKLASDAADAVSHKVYVAASVPDVWQLSAGSIRSAGRPPHDAAIPPASGTCR